MALLSVHDVVALNNYVIERNIHFMVLGGVILIHTPESIYIQVISCMASYYIIRNRVPFDEKMLFLR